MAWQVRRMPSAWYTSCYVEHLPPEEGHTGEIADCSW